MEMLFLVLVLLWNDKESALATPGCGSVINNTLKSPGYPNNYPPYMDCHYTVPIPQNQTMTISFIDFELEYQSSCSFDYLKIINDGIPVGEYCGQRSEPNILLTGDQISITFCSDGDVQEKGFLIYFTAGSHVPPKIILDAAMSCSAIGTPPIYIALIRNFTVLINTTNTASSNLYQGGNYTCMATSKYGTDEKHFVIKGVPPKIVLGAAMRVDPGSQVSCSGIGTPPIYIALIWNFTVLMNTTNNASSKLYQEGNYTCVAKSKYGADEKHFVIKGCGPVIENTLRSPRYPNNYPSNTDCVSSVPIPQGMVINITINELNLEGNISCDRDYLQITNEMNRVFGNYCGHITGKTLLVSGQYALIKFHSSRTIQNRGFLISFTSSVPEPVAFYPLNASYKAAEKENRQPEGILGDVTITNGPYNKPGGAYMFYGTDSSYIMFPNKGDMATKFTFTLMCWVQPGGQDGPLFSYHVPFYHTQGIGILQGRLLNEIVVMQESVTSVSFTITPEALPVGKWVHVAASYDHSTGNNSLYINGHLSVSLSFGKGYEIQAISPIVQMGSMRAGRSNCRKINFKGKIAEMKVYDVVLNEKQIQTSIRQVPPMLTFPAALLAIQGGMLSCSARGTPPIYTALIRNSLVLVNTTNTTTISLDTDGKYTCLAINQYGTVEKELQVNFATFGPEIGFLTSEGYPVSYPRNADSKSSYPIPEGWSINIYFEDFDVEDSPSCRKDFLRITDGTSGTFGMYCGNKTGQNLRVTGDKVEIIFHSDGKIEQRGYLLNFTLVSLPSVSSVPTSGQPTQEIAISYERMIYISSSIAFILLLVLCFILGFWCYRRSHHKRIKRSAHSTRKIVPLDKWELLPEQIEHEEELGRGAFGVVYKATLKKRVGIELFETEKTLKREEPCQVVAVKQLQDDASEDQKEEFLHEIEQMKLLGAHQNIVSLVGCCTLQEHKFLVIEYVPFGNLLQWLRHRRRLIDRNQGTGGNEEKKWYEDKEDFTAQREMRECGQGERDLQDENRALAIPGGFQVDKEIAMSSGQLSQENSKDLLNEENFKLMPMASTSQENRNAVAILMSTETIDDDDNEEAFLDQEKVALLPMPSTSQGNRNTSALLMSFENIDDDDDDEEEENNSGFPDQKELELLPMPSTSQGNSNASAILESTENNDDDDDDEADSFTTQTLFSFAWQIAKGMNHLAEKGFIHRDLAARNILVGNDNRLKVSDFGLMRQIYEEAYNARNTKKLPVKWMAPESINDSIYSIKSDVWSFGILLWEMATLGGVPYPTFTNRELCRLLKTGYRMERPDMCCDEAYELMSECWNEDPSSRPSFSELIDRLEVVMTKNVPYCALDKHDESRPYYNVPVNADGHSG